MRYTNQQSTFQSTEDGFELFWQKWAPETPPEKIIVFQHGIGDHSSRYGNLLKAFENDSTAFYALDARGHGRTAGKRGHIDSFQLFAEDLGNLIQIARKENPHLPLYLLAHSTGTLMSLKYVLNSDNQENLSGLLLSAPPIKLELSIFNRVLSVLARLLANIIPAVTMNVKVDANRYTHDLEAVKSYKEDPLVHSRLSMGLATEIFAYSRWALKEAQDIHIPVYIWHGLEDKICMAEGSQELFDSLLGKNKTLKFYDALYHDTMNEDGDSKWQVLFDVKSWVDAQKRPAGVLT